MEAVGGYRGRLRRRDTRQLGAWIVFLSNRLDRLSWTDAGVRMEYLDLSVYSYYTFPLEMLNVGWLGPAHGLPRERDDPMLESDVELLRGASQRRSNVMLGWHECHWCGYGDPLVGNGEYHYYAPGGEIYAAPAMILHYVEAHGYRPPPAFVNLLRTPGELSWDWRSDRLAGVLADKSNELEFRCLVISDLSSWRCPQALDVLLSAAQDPLLADIAGDEVGRSLGPLLSCDFAADVHPERLHPFVRHGIADQLRSP
jgi:hypothetical protein